MLWLPDRLHQVPVLKLNSHPLIQNYRHIGLHVIVQVPLVSLVSIGCISKQLSEVGCQSTLTAFLLTFQHC